MTSDLDNLQSIVSLPRLQEGLQAALGEVRGDPVGIEKIVRRPCPYSSSFLIEELDVVLADGTTLELMFKDLSESALLQSAKKIKPRIFYDPMREIETYRRLLGPCSSPGTAAFSGAVIAPAAAQYWLFVERLNGDLLWQVGDFEAWKGVARWLGGLHAHVEFCRDFQQAAKSVPLIAYNRDFFQCWMSRAQTFVGSGDSAAAPEAKASLAWLAGRYESVIKRLLRMPRTFIHGEFYASNVLVGQREGTPRVCPVDWEMAAWGPPLIDLAALTSGAWTREQKTAMAQVYHAELPPALVPRDFSTFLEDLEYCRLHQAVQWLGWSPDWTPPAGHDQNWLKEAISIAEALRI